MTDIVERLRTENTLTGYYDPPQLQEEAADEIERLRAEIVLLEATGAEAADEIERLRACVVAARRGGVEAAMAVASQRAASRHGTAAHCVSDRSKKHMQIRADEAGQLVADIRALLENSHD